MKFSLLVCVVIFVLSCSSGLWVDQTLQYAGENRLELENVLNHYKDNAEKRKATRFLIENMVNKYYYTGRLMDRYDVLFHLYDSLHRNDIITGDPPVITSTWDSIENRFGKLTPQSLELNLDCRTLPSDFLVENIETAFNAKQSRFPFLDNSFETFCEFVLPYRAGNEYPEDYRKRYYTEFKHLIDTVADTDTIGLLDAFHREFHKERKIRVSNQLWDYPISIPVSKMELGKRGACRHQTVYCASVMRACGLPVGIDFVKSWGNRSQGHEWNVLLLKDGNIYPFDAFQSKRAELLYKPAKIFRKMFANHYLPEDIPALDEVPATLLCPDEMDVTHQYGKTYNVEVECTYKYQGEKKKRYGVICVFDNTQWKPIYYGKISGNKMTFPNMMGDVCYMAGYYDQGDIIPATDPFILEKDGHIHLLTTDHTNKSDMILQRKYPRFPRMELFAAGIRRSKVEASHEPGFKNPTLLFDLGITPIDVSDTNLKATEKFRYVRWKIVSYRNGNLAEVEFYGKRSPDEPETKLTGTIIGAPAVSEEQLHPYTHAMDGDPDTYFSKKREELGYVGLDLGKGNEHYITRVRYWPRSDTNFILIGDTYELCYWNQGKWHSMGKKVATDLTITFEQVPQNTFYILHNRTKGKEERIFTYENGKQVWW
ncbi:transglutaminase domain-containing protein [Bacteroides sp. 224]|uniref:transglutaminase domain-containing protein n=1 Tax=Bacteroides sp. 224 TaxID=2302936 RepID=UPI0013D3CDAE|nr:transglutaminase domain-containing protein [Bacteroides sp. 224]